MEFGDRLRILMKKEGVSQNKLAQDTGEHPTAISSYLSGKRKPKVEFIFNVIQVFKDADLNWLFRGDITEPTMANEAEIKYETPQTPEVLIEIIEEKIKQLKAQMSQK